MTCVFPPPPPEPDSPQPEDEDEDEDGSLPDPIRTGQWTAEEPPHEDEGEGERALFDRRSDLPPWIRPSSPPQFVQPPSPSSSSPLSPPPSPRPSLHAYITVMDEIRIALDGEQRCAVLMLTSVAGPPYPTIAFREKQLTQLIPMLQDLLRDLSQLPLE